MRPGADTHGAGNWPVIVIGLNALGAEGADGFNGGFFAVRAIFEHRDFKRIVTAGAEEIPFGIGGWVGRIEQNGEAGAEGMNPGGVGHRADGVEVFDGALAFPGVLGIARIEGAVEAVEESAGIGFMNNVPIFERGVGAKLLNDLAGFLGVFGAGIGLAANGVLRIGGGDGHVGIAGFIFG